MYIREQGETKERTLFVIRNFFKQIRGGVARHRPFEGTEKRNFKMKIQRFSFQIAIEKRQTGSAQRHVHR